MSKPSISLAILVLVQLLGVLPGRGQNGGDQIIDGIGETALVTRHLFRGNERDSSRNSQHASLQGEGGTYVRDTQYGRVLSLPGGNGAYAQIPGPALDGLDTISVSAWFQLKASEPAPLFAFGASAVSNLFCGPMAGGYGVSLVSGDSPNNATLNLPSLPTNRWIHLVVVLDAANKALIAYVDGAKVGQVTNVTLTMEHVLNQEDGNFNRAFIGRSQDEAVSRLNGLVRDFRIYSVALTEQQVGVIRKNALSGGETAANAATNQARPPMHGSGIAQPLAAKLLGVPDVTVETTVGILPHLPFWLPGKYSAKTTGPDVRVIWPAPTNNAQVLTAGVYTVVGKVPGTTFEPKATVKVKASVKKPALPPRQLETFPLGSVTLLQDNEQRDTPFIKNRDKFIRVMAKTNPDNFLYMFRNAFGQPQPPGAEPLGVWDSQTTRLRGHATGHYISAIAQAYASTTYDEVLHAEFGKKMDYLIDTLYDLAQKSGTLTNAGASFVAEPTQVPFGPGKTNFNSDLSEAGIRTDYWNWGKGFISAYPPDQFIMLEKGALYGGNNNQIWAPYYTLHKILAGLLDCYEVGGNKKALAVAEGMGSWVYARLKAVPTETRISMWNRYIAGEYGGMNEVLARLSRVTGDAKFMECAKLFDNINFFFGDAQHTHGLAKNVDTIRGKHANQHIPQIIGALETYRDTKEQDYWFIAENFWEITTHSYMYNIGGVAGARSPNNAECFTAQPDTTFANGFANGGQNETCATYNMLKLSRQLFLFEQDARYMDYYEQALYNHILASVAENDPGNTYHVPLNSAARKQFGNARMDGFTCCNGTAIESNTKLQDSIYFKSADNQTLYVNLYVPSKLTWAERKVTLTQHTDFPYADTTKLTVENGGKFVLKVRVPQWATQGFTVKINGKNQKVKAEPGTYLALGKSWKNGDAIELQMPFSFRLSPVMDQPNLASLFYGPVLLAAQEPGTRADWRPITLDSDLSKSISGDPKTLRFKAGDADFKPFYETYGRNSVYLDVLLK
ncbi:MAG: glycoside hydrolase family 127 protein [Verrucomicrobiota bacterium]